MKDMKDFISRAQAQRILGCDKDTMVKLLRTGEIDSSRKENGGWLVSYDSLEIYLSTTWTVRDGDVAALQKAIAKLKSENQALKKLLDDNGISYERVLGDELPSPPREITIIDLDIPPRALRSLDLYGIHTIEQLCRMTRKDLLAMDGIGKKAVMAINAQLSKNGFELRKY
jgi:DNA-directed RNA polymerase alpha subunit